VYKNGILFGKRDITAWPYYDDGGYIGMGFVSANGAKVDDFGGGTITGGMQSMLTAGEAAFASTETLEADPWNVETNTAAQFWQGMPLDSSQSAAIRFTNVAVNKNTPFLKPLSNGVWGDDVVQVVYDVKNARIQVWRYDSAKGWIQVGKDIPTKFTSGDVFTVRVPADGMVEIQRNGKFLAARDATP
jgi:hypothetical protein